MRTKATDVQKHNYKLAIRNGDIEEQLKYENLLSCKERLNIRKELMSEVVESLFLTGNFITLEEANTFLERGDVDRILKKVMCCFVKII